MTNMLSTATVVRKINNTNNKGYIKKKLNEETNSGDIHHAKAILKSFKLKRLERIKTEKTLEGDEVKIVDLSEMPPLESDEVQILDLSEMPQLDSDEEEIKS